MAGYVRQRNSEIANGNLADASHVAEEFNQLQTAFNSTTGHSHNGSTGEGAPITTVGPAQDLVVSASTVQPKTNNTLSLGTSSLRFSNVHTNGLTLSGTAVTATAAELNILDGVTATAAELNLLDGVTSTTAELNILDGVTATALEINVLDGITSSTAELNILDGVTATATEINFIDGVTSNIQTQLDTKAPIANPTFTGTATFPSVDINGGNIDGTAIGATIAAAGSFTTITIGGTAITSTAAELNALDGITATVTELNYTDGVTSNIQTQLDGKQPLDSDLTAIAAVSSAGLITRTGSGTAVARTVTGTANQITITNGDGVSGNPTIAASIASQAEAEAGTDTTKLLTSQRVAQAIGYRRRIFYAVQQKATGVVGDNAVATTWNARPLTDVLFNSLGASLSGGNAVLPAGVYRVTASDPAYNVNGHCLRFFDVAGAAVLGKGPSAYARSSGDAHTTEARFDGVFTLASAGSVRLDHFTEGGGVSTFFGIEANDGSPEIYASVIFEWMGPV